MPAERGVTVADLKGWRLRATLTQGQLAGKAGVARATIVRGEGGGTLSIPNVQALAAALGITVEQLRFESPREPGASRPEGRE